MDAADELIERDGALRDLHAALGRARAGRGELVPVAGEAGSGKSALVHSFLAHAAGRPLTMLGSCDPLSVPRPFGPLIDAAGAIDPVAAERLATGASRLEAFAIAMSLINGNALDEVSRGTVFVIEDAHWADEATLDLITYLGRRISTLPALLVVTFRDDEVDARHPLRSVLGELASAIRCRVRLASLSVEAVAALAGDSEVDPVVLHRLTGGNPFHVTELLAAGVTELPESIRDAVLARAQRLTDDGRAVLDAAAIVPGRAERQLLDAIAAGADVSVGMEECIARGLLVPDGGATTFRHELARLAILDALTGTRRRAFHARALAALRRLAPVPTRLVFHAAEADDGDAVLEHASLAAGEAAAAGAHREAAGHLERALRYRHLLVPAAVVDLLLQVGAELDIVGPPERAIAVHDEATVLAERLGDADRQAEAMTRSARQLVGLGRQSEAMDLVAAAEALLATHPPTRASALVASAMSSLRMLARQFPEAEHEGRRAIELGEGVGDVRVVADARIQSGIALAMSGDDAGLARIEAGIAAAMELGDDNLVVLGHMQIGSGYGEIRRYDVALPALRTGLALAVEREVETSVTYATAWLARCALETGDWDDAATLAARLVRNPRCVGISRFVALVTLSWLRGRRGDPNTGPLLDEALALAQATRHLQRLWPVAACRAEIAWLRGNLAAEMAVVDEVATTAAQLGYRPAIEELAHWQRIADGIDRGVVATAQTPFGLSAAGRPDLAAARWAELGCPYEEAMARATIGDADGLTIAHRIFDRLGAVPMRTRTAAALRDAGATVPRPPRTPVSTHPHGLTGREVDVLALVATGRTDREIGAVLFIAPKTVGHHVSHVLAKLGVRSRAEAAVAAERLGLTSSP